MWQIEKEIILWWRQGSVCVCMYCESVCWSFPLRVSLGSESSSWPVSVSQPIGLWNDPPWGSPGAPQPLSAVLLTLSLPNYVLFLFSISTLFLLYIHSPHLIHWLFSLSLMQAKSLTFSLFSRDIMFPVCKASIRITSCSERGETEPCFFIVQWKCSRNRNSLSQQQSCFL